MEEPMEKTGVYDVAVIGAGVTGCAVARELARFALRIAVIDRESDVGEGTSKANSAIIHAGFDAVPGSEKARLNVLGNRMMDRISDELDIPFRRNGALVVCWDEAGEEKLRSLRERGEKNGVEGLRVLSREEAVKMEPGLADGVRAALYAPTSGIVCPFEMTIAYAENACANGAEFLLSSEVEEIRRAKDGFRIRTARGAVTAKVVVNCAGVYADRIHDMVCAPSFRIVPRKGEYLLLDKTAGQTVRHTVFQIPTEMGKGVLVAPTVHGNLITGPTAEDIEDREDVSTTRRGLETVREVASRSVKDIPFRQVITSFSGLRATGDTGDFILGEDGEVKGFIDAAGIESPGLSSAPAIALEICGIVRGILRPEERKGFEPLRKGIVRPASLPEEERKKLIAERPEYGRIVCRCEQISEGEILDSIRRPLGARTLDGVKRRVRAGMGRCQGGFCSPRVTELLAAEQGISFGEVKKNG